MQSLSFRSLRVSRIKLVCRHFRADTIGWLDFVCKMVSGCEMHALDVSRSSDSYTQTHTHTLENQLKLFGRWVFPTAQYVEHNQSIAFSMACWKQVNNKQHLHSTSILHAISNNTESNWMAINHLVERPLENIPNAMHSIGEIGKGNLANVTHK